MSWDLRSPLRYPGAKRNIAPLIEKLLIDYNYTDRVFVEPCCGGASVSLYLLEQEVVSKVVLIDKDPWVASFWKMLFFHTKHLLQDIQNVEVSVETWEAMKKKEPKTMREKALYCFFFNRTCYSGILKGGMIGGRAQASKYKIDCRFNKNELLARMELIASRFSSKIKEVRVGSVFNVLERAELEEQEDHIYYIDPPYVQKGEKLYPHYFHKKEHLRLKQTLEELSRPWVLSYNDHPDVLDMYCSNASLRHISLEVLHVADRARPSKEWLITNFPNLKAEQVLNELIQWSELEHLSADQQETCTHIETGAL